MPRKGWVTFVVMMLIPTLLGVGVYIKLQRVARQMEADVRAFAAMRAERPALEPVVPGTFEERVKPLVAKVAGPHAPWKEPWLTGAAGKTWVEIRNGERPLSELPVEAQEQLDVLRPWYLAILQATHAERPSQPVDRLAGMEDSRGQGLQHAARLAAIDQLRLIEAGKPGEALRLCVDTLALARDTGAGGTLLDAMFGAGILGIVRHPCARAIDAASADEQRAALADFLVVRQGFPTSSDWMRSEVVVQELLFCGFASDEELDELPGGSGALAKSSSLDALRGPHAWAFALNGFAELKRRNQAAVAAMALPPTERKAALASLKGEFGATREDPTMNFERFAERTERRDLMLLQLQCLLELGLGHAEQDGWSPSAACAPLTRVEGDDAVVTVVDEFTPDGKPESLAETLHPKQEPPR